MTPDNTERQVSPTRDGIRRDHVARYEWAAQMLEGARVADLGCGIGYGTQLLAEHGCTAYGVDRDHNTIYYAKTHYAHDRASFACFDLAPGTDLLSVKLQNLDAVVCFEIVEHIEDPRPMLKAAHKAAGLLIASVPNETVFPWRNYAHHFRHYTRHDFESLLNECGWTVTGWHGQKGRVSEVKKDINGRTLIAVCRRTREKKAAPVTPKHVAILGLGPSLEQYVDICKRLGGRHAYCDETWGINSLGGVLQCDLIFHMDDVRIQEIRAKAKPESNIARMLDWMRKTKTPIMTSRTHPDYPTLVEFPLQDAMNNLQHDYFNSTAAYAVAFAVLMGVERISLFGCDYSYPNAHQAEKGRACLEFWLGLATERGIKVTLPKTTTLMDATQSSQERLYGYDTLDVHFKDEGGVLKVSFTEREDLPTAEEIEDRYDHSAHPNTIVEGEKD